MRKVRTIRLARLWNLGTSSGGQAVETTEEAAAMPEGNVTVAGSVTIKNTSHTLTIELQGSADDARTWNVVTSTTMTGVGTFRLTRPNFIYGLARVAVRLAGNTSFARVEDLVVTFVQA